MSNKEKFLDIDYIGGLGSLSKEDEQKLSAYFKSKNEARLKKIRVRKTVKKSTQGAK